MENTETHTTLDTRHRTKTNKAKKTHCNFVLFHLRVQVTWYDP